MTSKAQITKIASRDGVDARVIERDYVMAHIERARRAGGGAGHLTPFDPVAVWWLDQRLARSAT